MPRFLKIRRADEYWACYKCGQKHYFRMTRCPNS